MMLRRVWVKLIEINNKKIHIIVRKEDFLIFKNIFYFNLKMLFP